MRKAVKVGAWGLIVGLPLLSLVSGWDSVAWWFAGGHGLTGWERALGLINTVAPLLLAVLFATAFGGACLLIADIHERLHREA
jgi:hypothetical protein